MSERYTPHFFTKDNKPLGSEYFAVTLATPPESRKVQPEKPSKVIKNINY